MIMPKVLDPDKMKIGYVVLVAGPKLAIKKLQEEAGFGESSKWTHVAGSLGGYSLIEASLPRSHLADLQKEYVDKGYEIKVLQRKGQDIKKRYKIALWWATMNNLPYDILQFLWFPLSVIWAKAGVILHNLFSSHRRFLCSELIATGFYKEGDYLFGKPVENIMPADFDNPDIFEEITDIWQ